MCQVKTEAHRWQCHHHTEDLGEERHVTSRQIHQDMEMQTRQEILMRMAQPLIRWEAVTREVMAEIQIRHPEAVEYQTDTEAAVEWQEEEEVHHHREVQADQEDQVDNRRDDLQMTIKI